MYSLPLEQKKAIYMQAHGYFNGQWIANWMAKEWVVNNPPSLLWFINHHINYHHYTMEFLSTLQNLPSHAQLYVSFWVDSPQKPVIPDLPPQYQQNIYIYTQSRNHIMKTWYHTTYTLSHTQILCLLFLQTVAYTTNELHKPHVTNSKTHWIILYTVCLP